MSDSYTFLPAALNPPPQSTRTTSVLHQDPRSKCILLHFPAGEGLPLHTAPSSALLFILSGEASLQLGLDSRQAKTGDFVHMPAGLPHAILATTDLKLLLTLLL